MLTDIEKIASQSLINCHAYGLDSIVLDDTPGAMVRVFLARRLHDMWKNELPLGREMSVGFHAHHCDVKLMPIYGRVWNCLATPAPGLTPLYAFDYHSKIREGKGGFVRAAQKDRTFKIEMTEIQGSLSLKAWDIHSIYVPQSHQAAWVVFESKENPWYEPITYSNNPRLAEEKFGGLYCPMSVKSCKAKLKWLNRVLKNLQGGLCSPQDIPCLQ